MCELSIHSEITETVWCGTGHRIQDLPKSKDFSKGKIQMLKDWFKVGRPKAIITGMAVGWDMYLAEAALEENLPYFAYVPFLGQERIWPKNEQEKYHHLLKNAYSTKIISPGEYTVSKMHIRNKAMLDDSSGVLTLWNPNKRFGGTYSTLKEAIKRGRTVINFWGDEPQLLSPAKFKG